MLFLAELSLWLAMLIAAWGATAGLIGARRDQARLTTSARRAVPVTAALALIVLAALWQALLAPDLTLRLVASSVNAPLPWLYRLAALWSTTAGIAFVVVLALSASAAAVVLRAWKQRDALTSATAGVLSAGTAFGLVITAMMRPFARLEVAPPDGSGLRPMLQQWMMLVHPPAMFVAAAGAIVVLSLAVSPLLLNHDPGWRARARSWALVTWLALTIAILTGSWWIHVLAAENSLWATASIREGTIFPWLASAGLLQALTLGGPPDRRDRWSPGLATITAVLVGLGMYGAVVLIREGELPFVADVVVEALTGALFLSTGVVAWRTGRLARTPSRAGGGVLLGLGVVLFAVAAGAGVLRREHVATVAPGQPLSLSDPFGRSWSITSDGISLDAAAGYLARVVSVGVQRAATARAHVTTEQRQYMDLRGRPSHDPITRPGLLPGIAQDVRVTLLGVVDETREIVRIRVQFVPFVRWLWVAGALMIVGGTLLWWPRGEEP